MTTTKLITAVLAMALPAAPSAAQQKHDPGLPAASVEASAPIQILAAVS